MNFTEKLLGFLFSKKGAFLFVALPVLAYFLWQKIDFDISLQENNDIELSDLVRNKQNILKDSSFKGLFLSTVLSKPKINKITSSDKGIMFSNYLALDKTKYSNDVFKELQFLKKIEKVLEIKLSRELALARDRGKALEKHLFLLKKLQQEGKNKVKDITFKKEVVEKKLKKLNEDFKKNETNFFTSLDDFKSLEAKQIFNNVIAQKEDIAKKSSQRGVLKALENRFNLSLVKLEEKITLIEKNKEYLIFAIKFNS